MKKSLLLVFSLAIAYIVNMSADTFKCICTDGTVHIIHVTGKSPAARAAVDCNKLCGGKVKSIKNQEEKS